jgi:hypothetical protein
VFGKAIEPNHPTISPKSALVIVEIESAGVRAARDLT